jgi:hypothetical protein
MIGRSYFDGRPGSLAAAFLLVMIIAAISDIAACEQRLYS